MSKKPKVYRITEKYKKYTIDVHKKFLHWTWWSKLRYTQYHNKPVIAFDSLEKAQKYVKELIYEDTDPEVVWVSNLDEAAEKALLDE